MKLAAQLKGLIATTFLLAVAPTLGATVTNVSYGADSPSAAPAAVRGLQAGLQALEQSRYEQAQSALQAVQGRDRAAALAGLAQLYVTTGRLEQAVQAADSAARAGARVPAAAYKARALALMGKLDEAQAAAEAVQDDPQARRARLVLGEILLAQGRSQDARAVLMTIIDDYNSDRIGQDDAEGLALVGRAAHLLRSARDANDAYNEAERTGKKRVETLLWRGELFLDKYDTGHAEEVVKEALAIAPQHPDALVMLARIKLEQALDFGGAEKLLDQALKINPRHAGAYFVRAGIALRDFDLQAADAAIDRGLASEPRNLALLSMRATTRFLADDTAGFEQARKHVLSLNPEYSSMYQIIGEFADWEHRYSAIVAMMKDAVQVDPRDGKAWAVLGLNLIRLGQDDEGVEALRKAWRFDKFNVRAYNTLNLYEQDIPQFYATVTLNHFRYRFDKSERAVLERYVPPLLERAYESMTKRYGFSPSLPIGIELYGSREHFSVRTSGLPNVGIQGVCFGNTLAATSPKGEPFNWGNVLWHELAHVYAIQLSNSHVPRWFTEGLSEYETFRQQPDWQREEDLALYQALKAGRIPPIAHFNRAFTHVEDAADITMAYYAASQVVTFIGEHWGMDKLVLMLRLWGQGKRDGQVISEALGLTMNQLDEQFRSWLRPRLARYEKQFVPDLRAQPLEQAQKAAQEQPQDANRQVQLALAYLAEGEEEKGLKALEAAHKLEPKAPLVQYVRARLAIKKRNLAAASQLLNNMVRDGHDGFAVRMLLADVAEMVKDADAMRAHLEAARRFDPTQVEALAALYDLARKQGRRADALAALRELSVLDQHERRAYGRLMAQLEDAGLWDEMLQVGARAIYADVHSALVHRLYGEALARAGNEQAARFELETALLCEQEDKDRAKVHVLVAKLHRDAGRMKEAKQAAHEALQLDPENADAKALSK